MAIIPAAAGASRRLVSSRRRDGSAARPHTDDVPMRAMRFTSAILCISLLLQRFGVPFGSKPFSIVGPLGLALAGLALAQGTLVFHRFRLGAYLALAVAVVAGLIWQAISPGGGFGGGPNLSSMAQFLLLTSFAVLSFAEPIDEMRFFRKVNFWFVIIAIAGILQFFAQFLGLRVFAFTGILPDKLLFESGYNLQILIGVGDLMKSNGFFLIEPSMFSQVMALGLIIEMLAFRRPKHLGLFTAALLLSFSGTGMIVLGSFVIAAVIGMGGRGIAIAGGMVLLLAAALGIGFLFAPDMVNSVQQRVGEISQPGTSGHMRFVTPFWLLSDVLNQRPSAALVGLGSGVSSRLIMPYEYDVNTPIKVALDEGFPALLAYVLLFVGGRKSPVQANLTVPVCTMFFFAGDYGQFPPGLFLVLLLISVARLRAAEEPAGGPGRKPPATAPRRAAASSIAAS